MNLEDNSTRKQIRFVKDLINLHFISRKIFQVFLLVNFGIFWNIKLDSSKKKKEKRLLGSKNFIIEVKHFK